MWVECFKLISPTTVRLYFVYCPCITFRICTTIWLFIFVFHYMTNRSSLSLKERIAQIQNVNLVLLALFQMRNLIIPTVHHTQCKPEFLSNSSLYLYTGLLSFLTSLFVSCSCKSVAVPGNSMNDTVCHDSGRADATVLPHTAVNMLPIQSSTSNKPDVITRPVMLNSVPDISHIIGELLTHLKSLLSG